MLLTSNSSARSASSRRSRTPNNRRVNASNPLKDASQRVNPASKVGRPPLRSVQPLQARSQRSSLKALPNALPLPAWLRVLQQTEKVSWMATVVLVSGTLLTYGWSMYSQHQWGKEYQRLDSLRFNERQLSSSSEWLKNDIARKNDPKAHGLVPRSRDHIVVIPNSPLRSPLPMRTPASNSEQNKLTPAGY